MIKSLHNLLSESFKYRYTSWVFKSGAVSTQQTTKIGTYNMCEAAFRNINVILWKSAYYNHELDYITLRQL